MSEGSKSWVVPALRFPDFHDPWQRRPLAPHLEDCSSRVAATTSLPIYSSSRAGLVPQSSYYDGRTIINEGEYGVVPPNCFVYRHMSDDGRFAFNLNDTGTEIAVSKEYPVFRTIDLDRHFLLAKLNYSSDFKAFALSQKAGGTRTRLYFSKLRAWETLLPTLAEQQKIAGCLTSLDEIIVAQGQKLEVLKTYKRGLMQQLFPREGETTPRIRFPEFRDGPEWATHPFDKLVLKSFYGTSNPTSEKGRYPVLRMGNMVDGGLGFAKLAYINLDRESFEAIRLVRGDILLNRTNSLDLVGKISLFDIDMEVVTASYIVTYRLDTTRIVPSFCNFILNSTPYQRKIKALARPSISQANINPTTFRNELNIAMPSPTEQRRIADCLVSIDAQIATESSKLDALRTYKTGLVQQLFPVPEEI